MGAPQVFQRQLSKEGLQQLVNNSSGAGGGGGGGDGGGDATSMSAAAMSSEDLRDLFRLRAHTASDTYDAICCADEADEAADEDGEDPGGIIDLGTQTVNKEQASCCPAPWDASQKRLPLLHLLLRRQPFLLRTFAWVTCISLQTTS